MRCRHGASDKTRRVARLFVASSLIAAARSSGTGGLAAAFFALAVRPNTALYVPFCAGATGQRVSFLVRTCFEGVSIWVRC